VVVMSAVDKILPDEIDNGFYDRLEQIPILGKALVYISGLSVIRRYKD